MVELRSLPGFAGVAAAEMEQLERILVPETHPAGTMLFREGEEAEAFFIVVAGEVAIVKDAWGGRTLDTLKEGDFFGEMGVVDDAPRCASAQAVTDVSLLKVLGADFKALLAKSPSLALRVMTTITRRNSHNMSLEQMQWTGPRPLPRSRDGRVLVACSMSGGSGVSTAVLNLAYEIHRQCSGKVCVVDGSVEFGDLALMLDMVPASTLAHLAQDEVIDEALLEKTALHTEAGLDLLAAPLKPEQGDLLTGDFFARLIPMLRARYDYILIDTCHGLQDPLPALLEMADEILYVLTPRLHSIKNARLFLGVLKEMELDDTEVYFLLNRSGGAVQALDTSTVEESLGRSCFGSVPSDPARVDESIDRGSVLCRDDAASAVAQAFVRIARGLLDGKAPQTSKLSWLQKPQWLRRIKTSARAVTG